MRGFLNQISELKRSICLGLLAVGVDLIFNITFGSYPISVGNLAIYLAACSMSVVGVLITTTIGLLPESLWSAEYLNFARVLTIALALNYCAYKNWRVPSFIIAAASWILVFLPLNIYLSKLPQFAAATSPERLLLLAIGDIILCMVAGALLLRPEVWGRLTSRPRHTPLSTPLLYIIPLVATVTVLITMIALVDFNEARTLTGQAALIGALLLVVLIGSTLTAQRLSRYLIERRHELLEGHLPARPTMSGFSGLTSDHWRRKSFVEVTSRNSEETRTAEERYAPRIISEDQGILSIDRQGTILFINRTFINLAEIKNNDLVGRNLATIGLSPEILRKINQLIRRPTLKSNRILEARVNQLPNTIKFFEIAAVAPENNRSSAIANGENSLIITLKDVTDRRIVESHLLQAQKLRSLGGLISGLTHEFNNSLTTITGAASIGLKIKDEEKIRSAFTHILEASKQAAGLVKQLQDFSDGKPTLVKTHDLRALVEERLRLLKKLVTEQYEVKFERPEESLPVICDENLLMQAVTNLVMNSKESYGKEKGEIQISLSMEILDEDMADLTLGAHAGRYARLRIKDFGFGMTAEALSQAFNPLYSTKQSSGHAGLGLSIVYSIIRSHDGFLSVESYPQTGTTVSIYLPLADNLPEQVTAQTNEKISINTPQIPRGHNEKVLVVEDQGDVRELISMMLSSIGYNVTTCTSGEDALEKSAKTRFDLLLVDLVMPKIGGLDLARKIEGLNSEIKTIVMTGYGPDVERQAPEKNVLHKPFDMETLANAVRGALN